MKVLLTKSVVVSLLIIISGLNNHVYALNKNDQPKAGLAIKKEGLKPNDIVGSINGQKITYQELINNYYKSSPEESKDKNKLTTRKLTDYLNLYMAYRAKLLEARNAGYYQKEEILKEFNDYRHQYAFTYWFDKKLKEQLLNQLLERSKTEIHVSHILIRLSPTAPPKDTLAVWNKLMEARKKFYEGVPFRKLIKEYSSKRGDGLYLGGDLGYFSAGRTLKVFEDVAYNTPVDSVSMPFRSKYGYHLIYVQDVRPTVPDRLVSHIYFRTTGKNHSQKEALAKANKVYKELENGASWDSMVAKYSDDPISKNREGSIGWVNHNQYRPSLSDKIFALKKPHTYTRPFVSAYGVHIIRLDSIRTYINNAEKRQEYLYRLQRLPRFTNNTAMVLKRVQDKGNAKTFDKNYISFEKAIQNKPKIDFNNPGVLNGMMDKALFEINDKLYTVSDFLNWLKNESKGKKNFTYAYKYFQDFKNYATNDQIVPITENTFPKFDNDTKDYLDGLVVYQITQDSVWNYVDSDTASLKKLYAEYPQKYMFHTRYKFHRIASNKENILKKAIVLIKSGVPADSVRSRLKDELKKDRSSYLIVKPDMVNDISNFPYTNLANLKQNQLSGQFTFNNEKSVFYLDEILQPRKMTFDEAYNSLVTDLQPIREKEWLSHIEKKYSVKKYPEIIEKALEEQEH